MKNQVQRSCESLVLFLVIALSFASPNSCQGTSQGSPPKPVHPDSESNIPPKPNHTHTQTAKPDPFDTEDPTTQAKVILRRDLFSEENGKILYYALLVAQKANKEIPINGIWHIEHWPEIPNWERENESCYQVTEPWWTPFELNSTMAEFTIGDGTRSGTRYWNKPLLERTLYTMKIRAFTKTRFQDTDVLYFRTLDHLPVSKIVSILGGLFAVTAAAVCLSIFDFEWLKRVKIFSCGKSKESFSPVPEALSHKSFLKYTKRLLNTPGRLGNEFHLLGTLSSDVSTLCLHAQRVDNRKKNRYGNILPFDMTRVKLSIIDDNPSTDYINASFIKGYTQEVEYIACQGPKEETCHDFYRMIIEQNIELIVMLTNLNENGTEKCFKYYPNDGEILKIKEMTIICKKVDDLEYCIQRVIAIKRGDKNLVVTQLHFKKWPDFVCPDNTEVMLKFCDHIHKNLRKGCIVVHCSAGAGRTGTFIAIDILLQDVKSNNKISVFNTVLKLRQQRVSMVQTESQLGYIYKCVSLAIEGSLPKNREVV